MRKHKRIVLISILALILGSCGQKGPLRRPEQVQLLTAPESAAHWYDSKRVATV